MNNELKEMIRQIELKVEVFKQELIYEEEKRLTETYLNKFIVYNVEFSGINEYTIAKVNSVNANIKFDKINSYDSSLNITIVYPRNVDAIFSFKEMSVFTTDFKVFDTEEDARLYVEVI